MGDLKSMAEDVRRAKQGQMATPQTPWSIIRARRLHPSVADHAEQAQGNLAEAKEMQAQHHGAVMSALGAGGAPAMTGSVDNGQNEAEDYDPPAKGRLGAWQETISDFRQNPTD